MAGVQAHHGPVTESGHVRVGLGPPCRQPDERRLAQDEARDDVRPLGGGEHGRHTAVGVGDEVAAGRQRVDDDRLDVVGMVTIVDPADEVRLVAEGRRLQGPGLGTRRSGSVEEDDGHGPSMPCAPGERHTWCARGVGCRWGDVPCSLCVRQPICSGELPRSR